MFISLSDVENTLRAEDVEGLISLGAPQDEYLSEAKEITSALNALPLDRQAPANIIATISLVWTKTFNLSAQDIEKRLPAFQRITQKFLLNVGVKV